MSKSKENIAMHVLVLLSGGIDSTTCIEYYNAKGNTISSLFIDYGQPDSDKELKAATSISEFYNIELRHLNVTNCSVSHGYVPARNTLLLSLGLMNFNYECGMIALGIHAGTPYADCSQEYVQSMQRIYDLYTNGLIRIDTPFLDWTKSEIWDYAQMKNTPLYLTHSNNVKDLKINSDDLTKK